jgi:hypothetical protein
VTADNAHSVRLTVDEILLLGMLSGLSRAEAARMMLEADDAKRARQADRMTDIVGVGEA